jgi:hypothetical protein
MIKQLSGTLKVAGRILEGLLADDEASRRIREIKEKNSLSNILWM